MFSGWQCVPLDVQCDNVPHCADASDEDVCGPLRKDIDNSITLPPPALIQFDGRGATFVSLLNSSGVNGSSVCPETHFQCPDNGYCLPVFVLSNEVYDFPGHEDEVDCDSYKCPGFYRCRGFIVCVHASGLCDGVYQCPQRDDEWLCDATCPQSCTCYGLAFVCRDLFPVSLYPQLRYLDARDSGLNYPNSNNSLLIYPSLARCGLIEVTELSLPNLLTLDLSDNRLTSITDQHLSRLPNLWHLMLANNPRPRFSGAISHQDRYFLTSAPWTWVACPCQRWRCPRWASSPAWTPSTWAVYADNYKLCCPATLPLRFNPANCKVPSDEISSCQSLLRSNIYRAILSFFAVSAVAGSAVIFLKWLWPNLKIKWASRWPWPICVCWRQVAGRFRLARTGPDNFWTQACFWTRSVWPQHDKAAQNRISSGPVSQNNIRAVCA